MWHVLAPMATCIHVDTEMYVSALMCMQVTVNMHIYEVYVHTPVAMLKVNTRDRQVVHVLQPEMRCLRPFLNLDPGAKKRLLGLRKSIKILA